LTRSIYTNIEKAIDSSIELRSKKELILNFIARINHQSVIDEDWRKFVEKQKEEDLQTIIKDENLKEIETKKFIERSFSIGTIKTTGTDIDRILPPIPLFGKNSNRRAIKQRIIDKLLAFFEKFFGLL